MIRAALLAALVSLAGPVLAQGGVACRTVEHLEQSFSVCDVDMTSADVRLFLRDDDGNTIGGFTGLQDALDPNERLIFAMNGGMFHPDRRPVGLFIADGAAEQRLITTPGPGNFGMLPNGVFCGLDGSAAVIETLQFAAAPPDCQFATQSGPMLVIDGALHPRFIPGSSSLRIRNGVGTSDDGAGAVFAISDAPVNFHDFATLFRDTLGLPNALYLDGNVSRLFAPELSRRDGGTGLGPIIGVVD